MAQPLQPLPDMDNFAAGMQAVSQELTRFQNLPPIANGQALHAQILELNQMMVQRFEQLIHLCETLVQRFAQVNQHFAQMDHHFYQLMNRFDQLDETVARR
ncbi:hypothetical protein HD554DRAFT_2107445 [Boletus coccyginus]|nr:hypothetical protein HD554DRAFT_2107445 [Boletus coccyginus]